MQAGAASRPARTLLPPPTQSTRSDKDRPTEPSKPLAHACLASVTGGGDERTSAERRTRPGRPAGSARGCRKPTDQARATARAPTGPGGVSGRDTGRGTRRTLVLLPDGRVFSVRARAKVTCWERGAAGIVGELVGLDAPTVSVQDLARLGRQARCGWLADALVTVRPHGSPPLAFAAWRGDDGTPWPRSPSTAPSRPTPATRWPGCYARRYRPACHPSPCPTEPPGPAPDHPPGLARDHPVQHRRRPRPGSAQHHAA